MHSLTDHEPGQHGTPAFPAEYHYVTPDHPQYNMPLLWHKEWELIRVIEGTFHAYIDNVHYTAQKGDVLLIRDGMLHGGTADNCIYECFLFDLHGLYRSIDIAQKYLRPFYRNQLLPDILYSYKKTPEVSAIVEELTESFRTMLFSQMNTITKAGSKVPHSAAASLKYPGALKLPDTEDYSQLPLELITIGALARLFTYILRHKAYVYSHEGKTDNSHKLNPVKSVLEYIENHYSGRITLDDLAKEAGMNPKYFCRFFRSIAYQTPMAYVNLYRIERASQMLLETALPITSIGMECGFYDTSSFIKVFRKHKGMTPNQYRKQ